MPINMAGTPRLRPLPPLCTFWNFVLLVIWLCALAAVYIGIKGGSCNVQDESLHLGAQEWLLGAGITSAAMIPAFVLMSIVSLEGAFSRRCAGTSIMLMAMLAFDTLWWLMGAILLFRTNLECLTAGDPPATMGVVMWISWMALIPALIALSAPRRRSHHQTSPTLSTDSGSISVPIAQTPPPVYTSHTRLLETRRPEPRIAFGPTPSALEQVLSLPRPRPGQQPIAAMTSSRTIVAQPTASPRYTDSHPLPPALRPFTSLYAAIPVAGMPSAAVPLRTVSVMPAGGPASHPSRAPTRGPPPQYSAVCVAGSRAAIAATPHEAPPPYDTLHNQIDQITPV
eukprot:m.263334 g.263334  ORF g.263334 m.263334 type:complete len:340 (-) comp26625_c0_seq1:306-1325(-)